MCEFKFVEGNQISFQSRNTPFKEGFGQEDRPVAFPHVSVCETRCPVDVKLSSGAFPNRADYYDPGADGWQRWSRHSDWRPGIDNLRTKLASVRRELVRGE